MVAPGRGGLAKDIRRDSGSTEGDREEGSQASASGVGGCRYLPFWPGEAGLLAPFDELLFNAAGTLARGLKNDELTWHVVVVLLLLLTFFQRFCSHSALRWL